MNVVMTGTGDLVEIQAAAEGAAFSLKTMNELVEIARGGILKLLDIQRKILNLGEHREGTS